MEKVLPWILALALALPDQNLLLRLTSCSTNQMALSMMSFLYMTLLFIFHKSSFLTGADGIRDGHAKEKTQAG